MVPPLVLWQSPVGERYLSITKEPSPDIPPDCVFPVYHILPVPRETSLESFSDLFFPIFWETKHLNPERISCIWADGTVFLVCGLRI